MTKTIVYVTISTIVVLFFLASKSGMWESCRVVETRGGVEYSSTRHTLRWDRLEAYIRGLPEACKASLEGIFKRR
jgi:uncharacterized membrane protein YqjE